MKKIFTGIAFAALAVLLLIQLVPVSRANPPVEQDMPAPADVKAILRTACYDCHSNETHWELPAYVAPFSWLISQDVQKGRAALNFSTWNGSGEASEAPAEIVESITAGEMPPSIYFITHAEAKLSPAQVETLRAWAASANGAAEARGERRGHHDEESEDDD